MHKHLCLVALALLLGACQWRSHDGGFVALGDFGSLPRLPGGLDPAGGGASFESLLDRTGRGALAVTPHHAHLHEKDTDCVLPPGERLLLLALVSLPSGDAWYRVRTLTCGDGYLTSAEARR